MKNLLASFTCLIVAGCSPSPSSFDEGDEITEIPCAATTTTEVSPEEIPDFDAIAARSGTREASGTWADDSDASLDISVSVQDDVAFHITPTDPSCVNEVDRWEVAVDVTADVDGIAAATWTQHAPAFAGVDWTLGTWFDSTDAADLLDEAGEAPMATPKASITAQWGASAVSGVIEAPVDDPNTDASRELLAFE